MKGAIIMDLFSAIQKWVFGPSDTEYRLFHGQSIEQIGGTHGNSVLSCVAYHEAGRPIVEERCFIRFSSKAFLPHEIASYAILRITAEKIGTDFYIHQLLETNAAPTEDEAEFLHDFKTPCRFSDATYGTFTLDREFGVFYGNTLCSGQKIDLALDSEESIKLLHTLPNGLDRFLNSGAEYAAMELLDLANDWISQRKDEAQADMIAARFIESHGDVSPLDDSEEDIANEREITVKDMLQRISPLFLSLEQDGFLYMEFDDGGLFLGHRIHVEGNLLQGFTKADI